MVMMILMMMMGRRKLMIINACYGCNCAETLIGYYTQWTMMMTMIYDACMIYNACMIYVCSICMYVCMYDEGLREAELWRMLSLLQYKAEHDNKVCWSTYSIWCSTYSSIFLYLIIRKASKEQRAMNHAVVRRVATEMLRSKGKVMELLRAEDITKTGW